ncbi:unnamed protein product [Brassica rapa subsp. trilocularis]
MLGGFGKWIITRSEVTRCIHIALLSVQDNPINVHCYQLSSSCSLVTLSHYQCLLRFIPRGRHKLDLESSQSTETFVGYSVNDVSITDLEPR